MKKIIILLLSILLMGTQAKAQNYKPISFSTSIIPHGVIGKGHPKSPATPPVVYLEDNTLTFVADHPEYVLYIKDEDEEVVYSTVVTSAETEVTLPSYLSGTYEIELVMGYWLFTGWIDL
jgi:hypothetical protein